MTKLKNERLELIRDVTVSPEVRAMACELLELRAQNAKLVAESTALKSGCSFFSYGSEHNFEWHKTAEEAIKSAEGAIDDYRGEACDGWSEEVDSVCWGLIMQTATKVGERPRTEEDSCDPAITTVCDYALLPNIDYPEAGTFFAAVQAQGVVRFAKHNEEWAEHFEKQGALDGSADRRRSIADDAHNFAARLRQEEAL